jgi:hypothetical protein
VGASRVHASGFLRTIAVVVMTLGLVACSQTEGTARGVVTSVEGTLEEVTSFVVLVDGSELDFTPTADGDYDFPLSHLREHQRTGEPVLVGWEIVGSVRYALSLADG